MKTDRGRFREPTAAKVFPIRLKAADGASGAIAWLLDVIAPNAKLATAVLAIFRQTVKAGRLFAHPMARGVVEPGLVNRLAEGAKGAGRKPRVPVRSHINFGSRGKFSCLI